MESVVKPMYNFLKTQEFQIIYYWAESLDGFIARKNGSVDWLPEGDQQSPNGDFGYSEFLESIDTVIMGSKTFEKCVELGKDQWPYPQKIAYVWTNRQIQTIHNKEVIFTNKPFYVILDEHQSQYPHSQIWLVGGTEMYQSLQKESLVDLLMITQIPVSIYEGIENGINFDLYKKINTIQLSEKYNQDIYIMQLQEDI